MEGAPAAPAGESPTHLPLCHRSLPLLPHARAPPIGRAQVSLAADTPVDSWMGHYGYCWPDPEHKLGYDCVAPGSRYSVCVYFAVMTITSIGYGDIAATPKLPSEQIVATLLMLVRRLPPPHNPPTV